MTRNVFCGLSLHTFIRPPIRTPQRLSNYKKYESTLNVEGLEFPLTVKHIRKENSKI